jgi:hypothetical protein
MNKKLLALVAIIILIFSLLYINSIIQNTAFPGTDLMDINREYQTPEEYKAITTAESINYTGYVNMSRFYGGGWANFIDYETLEYYQDRVNNSGIFEKDELKYLAYVEYSEKVTISVTTDKYDQIHLSLNGQNDTLFQLAVAQINATGSEIMHWGDSYNEIANYSTQLTNVTIVFMDLKYSGVSGPVCGIFVHTYQIIIFNQNLELEMVIIAPSDSIVS